MERGDIIRMAREAGLGAALTHDGGEPRVWIEGADWHNELERFAALVAAHEREAIISKIESEICHAEINNLRLAPLFGQRHGPLAIRVDSLAAVVDAIRARGEK